MNAARGLSLAYVCADPGIPIDGAKGAAVHFRELGRALGEQGVRLAAFAARADHDPPAVPFPARVVPRQGSSGARRELDLLAGAASFLGALAESGGCDAVYERLSLFGIAGSIFSREQNIPHVVEVNAPLLEEQARFRSLELTALAAGAVKEVLANASLVLAVSEAVADHVRTLGVAAARVRVFANGANRALFESVCASARPPGFTGTVVTFVGSLKPWHGIPFLLDAFAQVRAQRRDVHLWIVGEGPHLGDVRRAVERDPAGVFASGAVPHEQVAAILAASDIVVCPYPADAPAYFSPLKLVEAMAARRALLASNVASVRSHVTHGESAWLFEPGSVASWRAGLDALVASRSLRERLAAAAHERFRRSHTWEARARELIAMIAALRPAAVKEAAS